MKKASVYRKAEEDIREIVLYIADDNPDAADAFRAALENARERLADLPEMGTIRHFGNPELINLRMLPVPKFKKYLIFYLNNDDGLEIVRVLHAARDIPSLFGEQVTESGQEQRAA
jgi:toxin ParE1/3/4